MFKHIHIVGSGAIGSVLAAKAQLKQYSIVRHLRSEPVESVRLLDGQNVTMDTQLNSWPESSDYESVIILPLKSYQISAAINEYVELFPKKSAVVLLHNGMGCYEQVASRLNSHYVYLATTSMGAYKPSAIECIHTGAGKTIVGAAGYTNNDLLHQSVMDFFQSLLSPVFWEDNIQKALWQKLAINSIINPLTAIHNILNGELLEPHYSAQLIQLASELTSVALAENQPISEAEVLTMTREVIQKTANNYSSMRQDVHNKKITEIDSINGFVLNCAKKHGIDCPTHRAVYEQVKALEN